MSRRSKGSRRRSRRGSGRSKRWRTHFDLLASPQKEVQNTLEMFVKR